MLKLYENIKSRRIELGMTQSQLAEKLGYADKSMIAKIEKGAVDLQQSKIIALAEALKMKPSDLMGWDESPVFEAAAGEGRLNGGYPTEEYRIKLEADEIVVRVVGRSMEPTLQDGDIVVIQAQSLIDYPRQIALVKINGEEATLKRVELKEDGVMLIGDNIDVYPPHFFTAEEVEQLPVKIEGVVTKLIRAFE